MVYKDMTYFTRIKKECFWDLSFTEEDVKKIILHGSTKDKSFLFEKILLNSTQLFDDLSMFSVEEIKYFIEHYRVSEFNKEFVLRRKNLVEVYFLKKPLKIEELKWIA